MARPGQITCRRHRLTSATLALFITGWTLPAASEAPAPPNVGVEARTERAAKKAFRKLMVNGYRIETRLPSDVDILTDQSFHAELERLFTSREAAADPEEAIQIQVDDLRVQAAGHLGTADEVIVPKGVFAASVRLVNRQGNSVGVMVIPVSPIELPTDVVQQGRSLGVAGAAMVYRLTLP